MVRAMGAMARYRQGPQSLVAWLIGIERNVINEMYRAGNRARSVAAPIEAADSADRSADRVVAEDEAQALRAAFAELPPDDQELLGLRVVARLDAESTARVLGKRAGAIRMAQARALGRLRVTLREAL
jgi:RNA polymerase sigma-70 factor (ECF subfamily)